MEIKASHQIVCDHCNAKLAQHHQEIPADAIGVSLKGEDDMKHQHHFCCESCMGSFLDNREKLNKKKNKSGLFKAKGEIAELKATASNLYWEVNLLESEGMTQKEKTQHHHNNKPYGNVEYADPKNHKYPIDTEEHVRAALSYINHAKNAAEYSSSELAAIKSKIHAAAKKFGITVSDEK